MPQITVKDRQGKEQVIEALNGETLMQSITGAGMGDLLALCGGMCSCATCHVYIGEGFIDKLPALSGDENELLDASQHRQANSRLSCQIRITDDLENLTATIAPED